MRLGNHYIFSPLKILTRFIIDDTDENSYYTWHNGEEGNVSPFDICNSPSNERFKKQTTYKFELFKLLYSVSTND